MGTDLIASLMSDTVIGVRVTDSVSISTRRPAVLYRTSHQLGRKDVLGANPTAKVWMVAVVNEAKSVRSGRNFIVVTVLSKG
ncbi:hypothetical protein Tdes44962_MAKER06605 [Teratosphaeria destructans]|uniref:Uncharacterized protein n=1 Tax=Teratosphaeria destructans TaxID=418781 RepID=A0A9W7W6W2_9PEZI|nr:hypothetical protein Tdes44962_MAKER06605 [Teratosphaeria destructans]